MDFTETWNNTCSKIGYAARLGKVNLLNRCIRDKKPVDVADNRGGSDINWTTHEGETALLLACKRRQGEVANAFVNLLLQYGADPNIVDNEEDSPLLEAIRKNNHQVVEQLIAAGADVNASDCSSWSPLHAAATFQDPFLVQCLLKQNACIDARDECGMTPIFTAAQHGCEQCLKELLSAARDRNMKNAVNIGAEDWATPLMIAAQQGFLNCLNLLIEFGADSNLKTTDNVTALHLSVQGNHEDCLDVLLKTMDLEPLIKAFHPSTFENKDWICPLHLAVEKGSYGCLKKLLSTGFSPDSLYCCDENNLARLITFLPEKETALSYAAYKKDTESMAILLAAGASCNPVNGAYHPLLRAMRTLDPNAFHMLIDHGVDVNYPRTISPSRVALNEVFLCSFFAHPNLMRLVLYHGCDPNLSFQNESDVFFFIRCVGQFMRRNILDLPGLLKFLLQFLIINRGVQCAFHELNSLFPSDLEEIFEEISKPSTLKQICTIKLRQHLYSIHGVKLPHIIRLLGLPSFLEVDVAFYNLKLPVFHNYCNIHLLHNSCLKIIKISSQM
ncbi:hypothetical protein JTE90_001463 [Oedothorax gibbosus]|uniref:Uncharacterized protein n=1 Tax=Oedothorax gibbosus TaxID=931172 RepID=A0AAV6UBR3_9ARAC|nr:hypothetical protein JTE90_001463 [Oedothorax gibbosus]